MLKNSQIAELLAIESERAQGYVQQALRAASRRAFMWTEEAAELIRQGRALTELPNVGPRIQGLIERWIDDPPELPAPPELRRQFLTATEARAILARDSAMAELDQGRLADAYHLERW